MSIPSDKLFPQVSEKIVRSTSDELLPYESLILQMLISQLSYLI